MVQHALIEHYSELIQRGFPVLDGHCPYHGDVAQRQIIQQSCSVKNQTRTISDRRASLNDI